MADKFWENYKHPLWQEKRLRILERDDFACQDCGSTDTELHVHHGYYENGKKPWEYPDEMLHTVCKDCHTQATFYRAEIERTIGYVAPALYACLLAEVQMSATALARVPVTILSSAHLDTIIERFSRESSSPVDMSEEQRGVFIERFWDRLVGKQIPLHKLERLLLLHADEERRNGGACK